MSSGLIIDTKYGPVRGTKRMSSMGPTFFSFQGIPYAQPPVGDLRFRDPQEPEPWVGVRGATKAGSACCSVKTFDVEDGDDVFGSEDCLHLNVYTQDIEPKSPLPVMVFIHGGGFMTGSSGEEFHGPDYLMQKNIVFVSINYRTGAFGFLSITDEEFGIPGNAGLKDQTMALNWVRDNIANFGGDPDNVTLFGSSAGAASVHYHLISEHSKELFHKAILQSGTVFNGWSLLKPANWPLRLARQIGWDNTDGVAGAVAFLQEAAAEDIARAQIQLLTPTEKAMGLFGSFGPVIEPYESEQCMIPADPLEMSRTAWSNEIPIIIGGTADEGLIGISNIEDNLANFGDGQNHVIMPVRLTRNSERAKSAADVIKAAYFEDEEPSMDHVTPYIELLTDKLFWHGIHRAVLSRMTHATAPTYLYRFDFDGGDFNVLKTIVAGPDVKGACHADDTPYLFNNMFNVPLVYNSSQFKTIERMVGLWTSFASTGDPNCDETKALVTWEPLESAETPFHCLNISDELTFIDLPETTRISVWDSLFEEDELF